MMIILNPDSGAEIKNIYYESVKYFDSSKGEEFKVGTMVKVEENLAAHIMNLCEFVVELSKEEALEYKAKQEKAKFKCGKCEFSTDTQIALLGHNRKHVSEAKLDDELGIPVIKAGEGIKEDVNTQENIDADLVREGITGEGIREEKHEVKVNF